MKGLNEELGSLIEGITRFYFNFHWKQEEVIGCVINDLQAVAYFYDRSCEGRPFYTTITTEGESIGESIVDEYDFWKKPKNSFVLERTNPLPFFLCLLKRCLIVKKKR